MTPQNPSPIVTFNIPDLLNFALFAQDFAGLHEPPIPEWPYRKDSEFKIIVSEEVFSSAAQEWTDWWTQISNNRYITINNGTNSENATLSNDSNTLDKYPNLQQVISWAWPEFNRWWHLPYVGGKMALEAVPASRSLELRQQLKQISGDNWTFDIVYRQPVQERIIKQTSKPFWGIITPNDLWKTDWIEQISR